MKKLDVSWDGIADRTGYLFSFAKSLACTLKHSPWPEYAEDIIASSGFAFRMWVSHDLCPSATSMWEFKKQPVWVENGGFACHYVERLWGQEAVEEERRKAAVDMIRASVDRGMPAISWDIGVPEWGLIVGYDDHTQTFSTLSVMREGEMPYSQLGRREIPILSVLTVMEKTDKSQEQILQDTMRLALSHLKGEEWCENAGGLKAYPALIKHFEGEFNPDESWNMEYFLGTFGGLKYYAWKYFEKYGQSELVGLYSEIERAWREAFGIKTGEDITKQETREKIAALLKTAQQKEEEAAAVMSGLVSVKG